MFHIIHLDIWGSSRINSSLSFYYFVTLIDYYTLCKWLFIMKNRFKLPSIFQKFHAEIRNQFGISVKKLITDNAREYFPLFFMTSQRVLHFFSCARTPHQNGVVSERIDILLKYLEHCSSIIMSIYVFGVMSLLMLVI